VQQRMTLSDRYRESRVGAVASPRMPRGKVIGANSRKLKSEPTPTAPMVSYPSGNKKALEYLNLVISFPLGNEMLAHMVFF
jgi:hypothetical protein